MKLTLTTKEAAEFLQINIATLQNGLKNGTLKIGVAILNKTGSKYIYNIPKHKVEEYMGISYEDFLEMRRNEKNEKC